MFKWREAKKDIPMEENFEENLENDGSKIPVNDKRRFNEQGERVDASEGSQPESAAKKAAVPSQREVELEINLKTETERREAAEAKLVGVQAKFEELKAEMEKETAAMRERLKKSLEDRANQNKFNFLQTLLPVLDNLNRALAASEQDASVESLREGVSGVARSFEQTLANVGVTIVPSVGELFDPELHEAIEMVPAEADMDGRVVGEFQNGYKFGDKLLRPARVQVGKAV